MGISAAEYKLACAASGSFFLCDFGLRVDDSGLCTVLGLSTKPLLSTVTAFALVLNLDLILAGFGRGRRKILLFPDEMVLNGLRRFAAAGTPLSSDHSVVASPSNGGGISVLEARKFHHCGSPPLVPLVPGSSGDDDDSLESSGLPPLDAVFIMSRMVWLFMGT